MQFNKKGDEKKFEIIKGKIYYVSQDKNVIPIAVELGFSINPYEITDSGVLKSSSMNLYLVDNDGHLDLSEYEGKKETQQKYDEAYYRVKSITERYEDARKSYEKFRDSERNYKKIFREQVNQIENKITLRHEKLDQNFYIRQTFRFFL